MRTIDADALLKWLSEWELQEAPWWGANGYGDAKVAETIKEAIDAVEQMPTIDAVPVVRCKECRFSVVNENIDRKPLICGKTKMCGETTPDWFCAAGERSEE